MLTFSEEDIREVVKIDRDAIDRVEEVFIDLATKDVQMPPIMRVDIPAHNGEMDVKTAYIPGYDMFALKVSTGFFDNDKLGLPSTGGLMMLINATNGQVEAILNDNGYLTDVRTAAAGAVAAKHLANDQVNTVGVIGSGAQAFYQLQALQHVRDFEKVHVYSRSKEKLERFKGETEKELGITVHIENSAEAVVRNSELLITATPATEAVVKSEWVPKGMHITAMGSDAEHKQELDATVLKKADTVVCDVIQQCEVLGELRSALEKGVLTSTDNVRELGKIIHNRLNVRDNRTDITVADLTGTGAQDTKIALYAYHKLTMKK